MTKTVCVIGAGVAGLTTVKNCLEENFVPTCYEKDEDIGGVWNYTDTGQEGRPSLYKSCILNTSKATTCFSDFPFPEEYPNFMHHSIYKKYLDSYADHFILRPYFNFHHEVINVKKCAEFKETGRWQVLVRNRKTEVTEEKVFDFVLVCNGHYSIPLIPKFPGMAKFKGKIIHSHDYKTFHVFEDKRVLVVGIGNSASDVGCEISRHAHHVFMSTRNGTYVLQRTLNDGTPWDHVLLRRAFCALPNSWKIILLFRFLNSRYNNTKYGLSPNSPYKGKVATISDDLPNRILVGSLSVKDNVKEFKENSVIFEDGTEENIDVVIFATGYTFKFPFLEESILTIENHFPHLYKNILPLDLEHPTLGVIGLVCAFSPIPPILEMQARWAIALFKRRIKLPPGLAMRKLFEKDKILIENNFGKGSRFTIEIDFMTYMTSLADEIGCKPKLCRVFCSDPLFWRRLVFGPLVPEQWRIIGPGTWEGARDSIMKLQQTTWLPMRTRRAGENESKWLYLPIIYIVIFALVIGLMLLF